MSDPWAAFLPSSPAGDDDSWAGFVAPAGRDAAASGPDASRTLIRADGVPVGGDPAYRPDGIMPAGQIVAGARPDTWRRGTVAPVEKNTTTGALRFAVPQAALDVYDAFSLPYDVGVGNVDPMSPAGMKRTIGLAGLATGGTLTTPSRALVDASGRAVPKAVMRGLRDDGLSTVDVAGRVAAIGPEGVVADLGPNLRDKAAAIAATPGRAQRVVVDRLRERQRTAPDRLTGELDRTLGVAPVPSYVQRDIKASRKALGPDYDAAFVGAGPVDTTSLASGLDAMIPGLRGVAQTEAQSVRAMLNETGRDALDTSPETLFQVRQAIDGKLKTETDANARRILGQARAEVDATLAAAVPGIKRVDAQYAELARQHDAIDRGQTVLGNARTDPRPAELADEAAAGAIPSGEIVGPSGVTFRLRQGARAEIDRIVGTNLNDRAALNGLLKGESDWNRRRLATLFGEERVDRLYRVLDNERAMAETENKALAGSKTASLQAARDEIDGPPRRPGVARSAANLRVGDAAADLIDAIFGGVASRRRDGRNAAVADSLMSRGTFRDPGRTVPVNAGIPLNALLDVIMRPDDAPRRPADDDEAMRRAIMGGGALAF